MVGGYTIVETMIVLAVSGVLFISAVAVFNGKQGRSEFTTSMQDIRSKIQDLANDVATGYLPNSSFNSCTALSTGGPPKLAAGNNIGTSEECIFLGKALNFPSGPTNNGRFQAYTVIGRRLLPNSTAQTTNYSEAMPTVATELTEDDEIQGGAETQAVDASGIGTSPSNAVAFYHTLNTPAYGSTGTSIVEMYDLGDINDPSQMANCVNGTICKPLDKLSAITKWQLCFKSTTSDQFALITVTPLNSSVTTKLEFVGGC